jgi:putative aldouronate transport system substrate-binding protein
MFLLLTVLFALGFLACKPSGTRAAAGSGAAVKEGLNLTGYPISKEPITVTFAISSNGITGDTDKLDMMIKLAEITNITVKWVRLESAQIDVYYAAGDLPDLIYNTGTAQRIQTYGVEGGIFADWTNYLQYMPNLSWVFETDPFTRKIVTEINGEIYGLPMRNTGSTSATTRLMGRTDYLDALGLKMPETIDEFYTSLRMTADRGLTKGYAPLIAFDFGAFQSRLEPFFFASFGESIDPDYADDGRGKVVYNRISEQYKNFLKFMNRLYQEKLFENEYITIDRATSNSREKNGQALYGTEMMVLNPEDFADGRMHLDQVPPLTSRFTSTKKTKMYNHYRYEGGMMPKNARYAEEVARFVDMYFAQKEITPGSGIFCDSFIYGIFGRDFDYEDNGTTLVQRVPADINLAHGAYLTTYVKPTHSFGFYNNLAMGGTPNSLARQVGYVKNNIPYQVPYFPVAEMKFTGDEINLRNLYDNEITTYTREMRAKFIAGVADIDREWDAYVKTINDMRLSDVLKVYQAAYDRWNSY